MNQSKLHGHARAMQGSPRSRWVQFGMFALAGVVSSLSDAPAAISPSPPVIGTGNRRTPRTPIRARVPLLPSGPGGVGGSNAVRGVIGQCSQTQDQMCVLGPGAGAPRARLLAVSGKLSGGGFA